MYIKYKEKISILYYLLVICTNCENILLIKYQILFLYTKKINYFYLQNTIKINILMVSLNYIYKYNKIKLRLYCEHFIVLHNYIYAIISFFFHRSFVYNFRSSVILFNWFFVISQPLLISFTLKESVLYLWPCNSITHRKFQIVYYL